MTICTKLCLPQTYDARKEEQVECIMQALATDVGALYKTLAPKAYSNQVVGLSFKLILNSHRFFILLVIRHFDFDSGLLF